MQDKNFKMRFVEKISDFLKDRMEILDMFRLKNTSEFLTTDDVYQKYKNLTQEKEDKFISIRNYKDSVPIGQKVVFTKEEKEIVFNIIKEYLVTKDITQYPNSRRESSFLIDILNDIIANDSVSCELKEELKKYLVSLNCIHDFLSFHYDHEAFVCSESGHFYIMDHRGKRFVNYDIENPSENFIGNFTPLIANDSLKFFCIERKEDKEKVAFFGTHDVNEGYCMFVNDTLFDDADYNLFCCLSMSDYLNANGCSFLKKEIYDPNDLIEIAHSIKRFVNMSDNEKEELNKLSTKTAKFILERYECMSFCDNYEQALALSKGDVSEEIYELGQKEKVFINTLRDEIKSTLLKDDFVRINLSSTSIGMLRRVFNKSDLHFLQMFEELEIDFNKIDFNDVFNDKKTIYSNDDLNENLKMQ